VVDQTLASLSYALVASIKPFGENTTLSVRLSCALIDVKTVSDDMLASEIIGGKGVKAGVIKLGMTGKIFTTVGFATVEVADGVLVGPSVGSIVGSDVIATGSRLDRLATVETTSGGGAVVGTSPAGNAQANAPSERRSTAIIQLFLVEYKRFPLSSIRLFISHLHYQFIKAFSND
jgi:hypothetical protein